MVHVVLVEPQIAPNTGNIIRLCANTGATLHLVEPLGFSLDASSLRRAGLDYHELTSVHVHATWAVCRAALVGASRWFALYGSATRSYDEVSFIDDDVLVFGTERTGLTAEVRSCADIEPLRIPMRPGNRSLNLANAVAVVAYEAWRQRSFTGSDTCQTSASISEALRQTPYGDSSGGT